MRCSRDTTKERRSLEQQYMNQLADQREKMKDLENRLSDMEKSRDEASLNLMKAKDANQQERRRSKNLEGNNAERG